jgi:hypothetical protein
MTFFTLRRSEARAARILEGVEMKLHDAVKEECERNGNDEKDEQQIGLLTRHCGKRSLPC